MKGLRLVTRKELRAFFHSPVAFVFIGIFLVGTLLSFFTLGRFFGRNIADLRPLFERLPLLLLLLVSALTMRSWAEERRQGTLELFLTLSVRTRDIVLGKFLAVVVAVGVALLSTLPLPIMVSFMGDLDWGPVVGGYLGALMLGGAYASIGLAVSARTDNQIVALMGTLALGGALYLVGGSVITGFVGSSWAEILRGIGTGSRFESVARGVLDLRDIAYYAGITTFALTVNAVLLEVGRLDTGSARGRRRRFDQMTIVGLTAINVMLAVLWLTPLSSARIDMTSDGEYSLSPTTLRTLRSLEEPLVIEGYFSERSHPLLTPLVPQLRDLLQEYRIKSGGRVRVIFDDPSLYDEMQARLIEDYGIRPFPFRVADRTEQSVVNAYFHVVIRYGDRYEVLSFDQLVELDGDAEPARAGLRSPEYDITRTIRRVSQDFQTVDTLLASLSAPARLNFYVSPATVPEQFEELVDNIRRLGAEMSSRSGNFIWNEENPMNNPVLQQELKTNYQIMPMAADLFSDESFYLDLIFEAGANVERLIPNPETSMAELRSTLEAALQRAMPGQLRTVGIMSRNPEPPPMDPSRPFHPDAPPPDYQTLEMALSQTNRVVRLAPTDPIPPEVGILVVGKTGPMDEVSRRALDQFLMRGGSIIALAGRSSVRMTQSGPTIEDDGGLAEFLEPYGVFVEQGLVADTQNTTFLVPRPVEHAGGVHERLELVPYIFFPDIRGRGIVRGHPALSGILALSAPWASPLRVEVSPQVEVTRLLSSSADSWLRADSNITPNFYSFPEVGFADPPPEGRGEQLVGVALTGNFQTAFPEETDESAPLLERNLQWSLPGARLAVVSSAELVSDLLFMVLELPGSEVHQGNVQLVMNLVDWASADTDLLSIRRVGGFARTLRPMDAPERRRWELGQYGLALVIMAGLAILPAQRRRFSKPFTKEVA